MATIDELADGDIKPIEVEGTPMVLCRVGDEFFATQRKCLHQGGDLAEGIVSSGRIVCAVHGWRFDLRSGCHELSPMTCLRTYPTRIEGTDVLVSTTPNPMPATGSSTS